MSRLDRRALFTSGAAAALLAATGVSLEAAPRRGGRLRLAVPRADGRFEAAVAGAVYDTLTDVGPDGLLRAELATAWSSDARGIDWTIVLRRDARFHDGRAFTAEDAAASLAAYGIEGLCAASEPYVLSICLDAPNPDLPYLLADPSLVMLPEGVREEIPVGTGPYQAVQYRAGRHFLGRRVQPHFKDGIAGWVDEVEIAVIPDPAVRAEAVRDGFVDVADLPLTEGLGDLTALTLRGEGDLSLAARQGVGVPKTVGARAPLDDGRIAQRWWMI